MPRNFIQNKADITQYYVNRAKREEEKNQFKLVDTRRVKVPIRNGKSGNNKTDLSTERSVQREPSPLPPSPVQSSTSSSSNSQASATPDYRFLLAWSYYLATQTAWLSPMFQQKQQGQPPFSLPTDPEAAAKFLQAMQTVMNPLATTQISNNNKNKEQTGDEFDTETMVKEETNES
jgi:hypothetical protein